MSRLAIPIVLVLTGCGGATAELKLMDAPPAGVTAVEVFVAAMQVHVVDKDKAKDADPNDKSIDDDNYWESLAVGRSIDLVQHQGESAAELLGQLDLPEGKITQIRLVIDTTRPNTATYQGTKCDLDTSKVEVKGIKIDHPFKALDARPGAKHELWVDFKLDESLTAAGKCFVLLPKLKLHKVKVDGADIAF